MKKFIIIIFLLYMFSNLFAAKIDQYGAAEVAVGKQNVEEIAKTYKFIEDPYYVEKVNRIGNELAKIANENKIEATYGSDVLTPFDYEFRVIDGADINAFSVMGGFIYVYKGMIDFCESDDELAGIMAHEIIHAQHHHLIHLIEEQTKFSNQALVALAVGILASKGNPEILGGVAQAANMYTIAMTNGYSQEAERDSDHGAFFLISKTKYNPVGLLTPLERLAQKPDLVNLGIYRSHPITKERVMNMKKLLADADIPLDRYKVSGTIQHQIVAETKNNINVLSLYINSKYVLSLEDKGQETKNTLNSIVDSINNQMRQELESYNVSYDSNSVYIKGNAVFTPTEEALVLTGMNKDECIKNLSKILKNHILKRNLNIIV